MPVGNSRTRRTAAKGSRIRGFRERFEQAEAIGIVQMRPAFSRAPQDGVRYAQDRKVEDADDVWDLLGDPDKDAHV